MSLTDIQIRRAKPKDKTYKLFDGRGLYLEITPTGSKYWRWKYRFGHKEKRLSCGVYPDVSLQAAREKREEFRKQHSSGVDPGLARKEEKNARLRSTNFEVLARKWHSTFF